MSFKDFVKKYKLNNKATANIMIQQNLSDIGFDNVGIYFRDQPFSTDMGIVNLHWSKGTQWVSFINENSFDTYCCAPLKKLSKPIIKRNGYCLYSEYHIQKNMIAFEQLMDSICFLNIK